MDEPVTKATNENLTSENWEAILNVCDKVDADNENGARNAILAIQKRLGHRNANVQLFSLSLVEALSKNCGSKVHREIASRAFTQCLMRLLNDRTVHAKVKSRTAELIKQWSEEFKRDPSLGIMAETYSAVKAQGISIAPPPSRPQKRDITENDRKREEEELQIALAMSLNEAKISENASKSLPAGPSRRNEIDNGPNAYTMQNGRSEAVNDAYALPTTSSGVSQSTQAVQAPVAERTAATVSRVRALYDFSASEAGELTFRRGDVIQVIESAYKDWWRGSLHGSIGIFPTNYVEKLAEPTPADLRREAEDEQRVFAEAKNVEKLLSILSNASNDSNNATFAENEQLQDLYHSTISIRPKLVRLIEKYAQKKDDLISLNEKFMKARKDYDDLMEASLSRYSTSAYPSRQQHDPRQALYQQSNNVATNYPPSNHERAQYHEDARLSGQGFSPAAHDYAPYRQHEQRTAQGQPAFQQQVHPQFSQPSQFQTQQHQQRPSQGGARSESYRAPNIDTRNQGYGQRQAQNYAISAQGQQHPMSPQQSLQSPMSAESVHEVPSFPSQELQQAFPSAPRTLRTTSYDHERAEREGGPPISYYTENVEEAPAQGQDLPASNHMPPPASGLPDGDDEIPDYYRRTN